MTTLVLWDIDRTLINAGGVDKQVWLDVCTTLTGRSAVQAATTSGRTDPQILLDILTATGIGDTRARELLPQALQQEADLLARRHDELRQHGHALPGAAQALHALSVIPAITQTVVTGNVRPNAELKLATYGLAHHIDFSIGAYGSDDADRAHLILLAQQRARATGRWAGTIGDVVVLGDSPRDVQAARAAGVRVIAVATGRTPPSQLRQTGPDHLLPGLTDTSAVLTAILNGATASSGADLVGPATDNRDHRSARRDWRAVLREGTGPTS